MTLLPWTTAATAGIASAIALRYAPLPFFWLGLIWTVAAIVIAARATPLWQYLLLTAASIPVAVALGEAYFAFTGAPEIVHDTIPVLDVPDPLLGWKPAPGRSAHATETAAGIQIYDVTYSIDGAGHRISPPTGQGPVRGCVFFFADSFAFGEGVGDTEPFPYQVGIKSHGQLMVVNFSYKGYGAEHMLAMLERGDLTKHAPCVPTQIVYAALPHHVLRAAGKTTFSAFGPRYRLRSDGVPEYLGTRTRPNRDSRNWNDRLTDQLAKSRLYGALSERASEKDLQLYFGVVNEAYRRFARQWPEAKLYVIGWDVHDFFANGRERFHLGLEQVPAEKLYIDDILPGYAADPVKYGLHRFDVHPNPAAHEQIAAYLVDRMLTADRSATR